ncbi:unnamed protein product [Mytilus edulis]|uniref:Endonuclease/exonuclease/phosphatase domain-containing protein n=1 Tax=Mytilus edulis TaxID=6550 RepID=A0A8S3TSC2_MYTED|nr:unnamed protein product [Mytilus edulis]
MTTATMNSHHHAKVLYSQQNCRQYANQAVIFQNPILSSRQPYNTNQHIQPRQCIPEPIVPKKHVQKNKRQNYNKLIVQQDIADQSPMTEKCQNVENVAMCSTTEPKICDTEPNKDNVSTGNHANMTNLDCGRQDLVKEPISSTEDSDQQHHFFRARPGLNTEGLTRQFTIGTLNVQNALSNQLYLVNVLKKCDILCVQEHWLYSCDKHKLQEVNDTHVCEAKSVDDDLDTEILVRNRGYGGTAVFWRKDIDRAVKFTSDGNDRIVVLTFNISNNPLCLIGVYMPSHNRHGDEL